MKAHDILSVLLEKNKQSKMIDNGQCKTIFSWRAESLNPCFGWWNRQWFSRLAFLSTSSMHMSPVCWQGCKPVDVAVKLSTVTFNLRSEIKAEQLLVSGWCIVQYDYINQRGMVKLPKAMCVRRCSPGFATSKEHTHL